MNNIKISRHTIGVLFFILLSSVVLVLGFYLGIYYKEISRKNITYVNVVKHIDNWIELASLVKKNRFNRIYSGNNKTSLHLKAVNKREIAEIVLNSKDLNKYLNIKQRSKLNLSILISKNYYINITWHNKSIINLLIPPLIFLGLFLILLIISYSYFLKYILPNFSYVIDGIKRLSYNIKAPYLDISQGSSPEMKELIYLLNSMHEHVCKIIDNRTFILAAISHDLKTPITRLKLRAEFIEEKDIRKKIISDLDEIDYMISSILSYSREQNIEEQYQKFDIVALIEAIHSEYIDAGNKISCNIPIDSYIYKGRMISIRRAITNIINNALIYANDCCISLKSNEKDIEIIIEDKGPGIPEQLLSKVFDPFFRVDSSRSAQKENGTGLGLTICNDIISSHAGKLILQNYKYGLRVVITLPLN